MQCSPARFDCLWCRGGRWTCSELKISKLKPAHCTERCCAANAADVICGGDNYPVGLLLQVTFFIYTKIVITAALSLK